jgi:DNA-directed RNA polymerase subunit M/transcription elongation factor TFIIS
MPPKKVTKTALKKPTKTNNAINTSMGNDEDHRAAIRASIEDILAQHAQNEGQDVPRLAKSIERSCYNTSIKCASNDNIEVKWTNIGFRERYSTTCWRVISHMQTTPTLISRIFTEEIDENTIGELRSEDLAPESNKEEREIAEISKNQVIEKKYSEKYQCKKCGAKKTTFSQVQTRALDELTDTRIECLVCHSHWTIR